MRGIVFVNEEEEYANRRIHRPGIGPAAETEVKSMNGRSGAEKEPYEKRKGTRRRIPFWWILKTALLIFAVVFGTVYLNLRLGWTADAWQGLFFLAAALVFIPEMVVRRHGRRGEKLFKKLDYPAAYAAFEKEYRFLKKYPWLDRYRNWMLIFYYRDPLSAEAVCHMADSASLMGDLEQARGLCGKLKEEWPGSEAAARDFSFLEPEKYREFQKECKQVIEQALPEVSEDGEKTEARFFCAVTLRGGKGRRCKIQPCFVGITENNILLAALKKPEMEEIVWRERIPLPVISVNRKKSRYPNSEIIKLLFAGRRKMRIEVSYKLSFGQYPGQGKNIESFLQLLSGSAETN